MPSRDGRPSTSARGYGQRHRRSRAGWKPLVEAGAVSCWRCGRTIVPSLVWRAGRGGSKGRWLPNWVLGHRDFDRSADALPEHWRCNAVAATRKRVASRAGRRRPRVVTPSRQW